MTDPLTSATRQLIGAGSESKVRRTAITALESITGADQATCVPAAECKEGYKTWRGIGSIDAPDQRPILSGVIGQVYSTGETWVVDDLLDVRGASAQSATSRPGSFRSLLCVPVANWGVLVAVAREADAFSEEQREAAERLATFTTAALDRVSTSGQEEDPELLEEVASILSHDVSNQLTVAYGRLDLLRADQDPENVEAIEKVAATLERIEELTDDLATLARTGEHVEDVTDVDLRDVAERTWASIDTLDATLTVEGAATVEADESSLCQLLSNLFRNAVDHGDASVSVRVGVADDGNGFYVADDGDGIPPAERDRIFEHGYSTNDAQTGFGLSIVQQIAAAHGWQIDVAESADGGTRFDVTGASVDRGVRATE